MNTDVVVGLIATGVSLVFFMIWTIIQLRRVRDSRGPGADSSRE